MIGPRIHSLSSSCVSPPFPWQVLDAQLDTFMTPTPRIDTSRTVSALRVNGWTLSYISEDFRYAHPTCFCDRFFRTHTSHDIYSLKSNISAPTQANTTPSKTFIGITSYTSSRGRNVVFGDQHAFIVCGPFRQSLMRNKCAS